MKSPKPLWLPWLVCAALAGMIAPAISMGHEVKQLKVTILSTMLADEGIGEWGFAALLEADGRAVLIDTGARPQTVLENAAELKVDLSRVHEVVLTHFHSDHVGGLMTLRTELKKRDSAALESAYVTPAIFYSRPGGGDAEQNPMIAIRPLFEAGGGKFVEHENLNEIAPGVWLTGSIPRVFPERNWSGSGKVRTPQGVVEDTVPDDQSLIVETAQGLVIITGCGHAGIVNILTLADAKFHRPIAAVIGGVHLFRATDQQVDWTGEKMKGFGVKYLIGAHCTGIESLYRLRQRLGLDRHSAVVGAVGASFDLAQGIHPGQIAQ
jgi:7,8-dihydropterin-6-yl-methyl-4-(beta-D-ribofuranosyl)aminobenzene 5'-phosphate synthase